MVKMGKKLNETVTAACVFAEQQFNLTKAAILHLIVIHESSTQLEPKQTLLPKVTINLNKPLAGCEQLQFPTYCSGIKFK